MAALPEVLKWLLVTGQVNYQLTVVVADLDAFQALLLGKTTHNEGVCGVHSGFVLRRVMDKTALPV